MKRVTAGNGIFSSVLVWNSKMYRGYIRKNGVTCRYSRYLAPPSVEIASAVARERPTLPKVLTLRVHVQGFLERLESCTRTPIACRIAYIFSTLCSVIPFVPALIPAIS
jgi:hypothetical protein